MIVITFAFTNLNNAAPQSLQQLPKYPFHAKSENLKISFTCASFRKLLIIVY